MKRHSPAAAHNSGPIADVLARELPATGTVLEIASGSGEHAVFFARKFPQLQWQPSDPDIEALASVEAWREESGLPNLTGPISLDASRAEWPVLRANAVLCINMVHISPWEATRGLFTGAARLLDRGAPLVLYGPYREDDVALAPSNEAFDRDLKRRDPRWGLRRISDMDELGTQHGFTRTARYEMPANNLTLVYRRG